MLPPEGYVGRHEDYAVFYGIENIQKIG